MKSAHLLQVVPALSGAWPRGAARHIEPTALEPQCDQGGGRRQDRLPASALPLRSAQDRDVRIYDRLNQENAIRFIDYVFERLPFRVEVVETDNGPEFGSQFHYHVDAGAGHVHIKPATPRLNGKVERSHQIDAEEF
jgi:hypothetical protein